MKIPVFVSAPSDLNADQNEIYNGIVDLMGELGLERRALVRSDYPTRNPLREIIQLAKRCSGGLILGFRQVEAEKTVYKRGTVSERTEPASTFPTPWNQIEAAILYSLKHPVLAFREEGISGGVFDIGTTDLFVHKMPSLAEIHDRSSSFREVVVKRQAQVINNYYEA